MRVVPLLAVALLASQALSVQDRAAVSAWSDLIDLTMPEVEAGAAMPGADTTLMGQVAFLANAHTWLLDRYGQIPSLSALVELQRGWQGRGVSLPHLGHGFGGDLELSVARLARPGDPLVVGVYEQWILTLGNRSKESAWSREGFSVALHMADGSVRNPTLPGQDPAFAGTHIERNPHRFFLGPVLEPDTEARVILLLPPALESEITALEVTLAGESVWIPWWENLL